MDYDTYNSVIHRTAADKIHFDVVKPSTLIDVVEQRLARAPFLDAVKKGLFYGKHNDLLDHMQTMLFPEVAPSIEDNKDIVHALLGVDSESAELLAIIHQFLTTGEVPSREKLVDEAGDLLWYFTFFLKAAGIDLEEIMEHNHNKLAARFPEGTFTLEQWENDRATLG